MFEKWDSLRTGKVRKIGKFENLVSSRTRKVLWLSKVELLAETSGFEEALEAVVHCGLAAALERLERHRDVLVIRIEPLGELKRK
jgi:hypothetical protein